MSVTYKGKKYKAKMKKGVGNELNLQKKNIDDITQIVGLDKVPDLVSLNLDNNFISEIKGLSTLKDLRSLSLANNNIAKIEGLENLKLLERLKLENNQIVEIMGLENLINLKEIDLEKNQISELKGLENLEKLTYLNLCENRISELKGLENLQNLVTLKILSNPVYSWIRENLILSPITILAVKYCARQTGKEMLNLEQVQKFYSQIKQEISENSLDLWIKLKLAYFEVKLDDPRIFYDFFGEIITEFPQLLESKKNFWRKPFMDGYHRFTDSLIEKERYEMDKYVIDKFCTFENEKILISFYGKIFHLNVWYEGRIHLTDRRIFLIGNWRVQMAASKLERYSLQRDINVMSKYQAVLTGNLPSFGHQFPLSNLVGIARGKVGKDQVLSIGIMLQNRRIGIQIFPAPLKNEDEDELIERIKFIEAHITR